MMIAEGITMRMRNKVLILAVVISLSGQARAASEAVYDEKADAPKQIATAIAEASRSGKHVVLVFGANWCPDCHALDAQMHKPELAAIIGRNFLIVKVDVGRMDKNLDLAQKYGVPLRRGIPAMAVLDPQGKLLYAQDQGQFADARHLNFESIKAFFEQWKPKR
jgi:thioredoxin 1